jgi:ribosomal protein L14
MSKTHVIDGKKYVEVDRKAEVGDKIVVVKAHMSDNAYKNGDILTVKGRYNLEHSGVYVEGIDIGIRDYEYRLLAEVGEECCVYASQANPQVEVDERDASPSVVDMLANLARRVSSLEHQLASAKGDVEKLAQELSTKTHELDDKIEMALDDIVTLDERTQFVGINTKSSAKLLAEAFEKLSRYERIDRR